MLVADRFPDEVRLPQSLTTIGNFKLNVAAAYQQINDFCDLLCDFLEAKLVSLG